MTHWAHYGATVVFSGVLSHLSQQQLEAVLAMKEVVFARATPRRKLEIVRASQWLDECVDVVMGSNGRSGVADIILLADNISSIVRGIEQGRTIYANLK
ncbi:hypothetical protein PybrP1_006105 [[Pythium] brassicae (nom. inval.)]|nr:hypothetical protein PybrP1_006105 [[Pythium] brassicae (nom. inval.)]